MSSTTAQRRKAKPELESATVIESGEAKVTTGTGVPPTIATVRRNKCGTGPFDQYWLNLDCCGLICALFTYGLHAYGVYAVCLVLLPPWMSTIAEDGVRTLTAAGQFNRVAFTSIAAMAVLSHFKAMTTDPGAVPPDAKPVPEDFPEEIAEVDNPEAQSLVVPPQKIKRLCRRCKAYKPARAHHCSVCRRCVIKMDHHCPWVNNCVGIGNHKYFLLFIFYTCLSCMYSMILVIARFSTCSHSHSRRHHGGEATPDKQTCLDQPTQLLTILGLLIEALLFGLFTSCMMFDQMDVVGSKMTHIDRLKGADIASTLAGVTEVFGVGSRATARNAGESRFRADWLSPLHNVCFPESVRDEVMGFCRPCLNVVSGGETELSTRNGARSMEEIM